MALTPWLDSLEAMFRKLEREWVRTFHHHNVTHKADHFCNFRITAHSIRDYLLERLGKNKPKDRESFSYRWSKNLVLVAVADIANTAKHFQLRCRNGSLRRACTKQVRQGRTSIVDFYENVHGEIITKKRNGTPTYVVEVDRGNQFELSSFMTEVVEYWKSEMKSHGIKIRRQPYSMLHGI